MLDIPEIEICSQCDRSAEQACLICGTLMCKECFYPEEVCDSCYNDEEDYWDEAEMEEKDFEEWQSEYYGHGDIEE